MAYDLAVAGGGFGGLAAAALLSHAGKKVVLLEPAGDIGGVLSVLTIDGFRFATGPALCFGLERGGPLERIAAEMGISFAASVNSPVYQVALPDRRINIYAEAGETLEELRREFGTEVKTIAGLFRDARKKADRAVKSRLSSHIIKRQRASGFISGYGFSSEFTAFLDVQARIFFGRRASELSLASFISLIDTAPVAIKGGLRRLMEQMLDVFLETGGEIMYNTPWPRIERSNHKSVVLSTLRGPLEARTFLLNSSNASTGTSLCIGIRDDVVPVGMASDVICLSDYSSAGLHFSLTLSRAEDETAAPRGMRSLLASFPGVAPGTADAGVLLSQIRPLIPFLDGFMVFSHEHAPQPRVYDVASGRLKRISTAADAPLLYRMPSLPVYFIPDVNGAVVPTVHAVRRLVSSIL